MEYILTTSWSSTVHQHPFNEHSDLCRCFRPALKAGQRKCQAEAAENRLLRQCHHAMLCHVDFDSVIMVRLLNGHCLLLCRAIRKLTQFRGGTKYAWDSAGVLAPLILGVALLVAFLVVEIKVAPLPIIPSECIYLLHLRTRRSLAKTL